MTREDSVQALQTSLEAGRTHQTLSAAVVKLFRSCGVIGRCPVLRPQRVLPAIRPARL